MNESHPIKLIQSYVLEMFFISTGYRQSSAALAPDIWYYETIVFAWDKNTKLVTGMIDSLDSGSEPADALVSHNNICLRYYIKETNAKKCDQCDFYAGSSYKICQDCRRNLTTN